MDDDKSLCRSVAWRKEQRPDKTVTLGEMVSELMTRQITPRHARFASVVELWSQLLPDELYRHCRIAEISGGRLKITVDSPSYLHELRLRSSELLEQLQRDCPRAGIREIKFIVGQITGERKA